MAIPKTQVKKRDYQEFQDKFGFGPCGPIAYILRERGHGDIYFGYFGPPEDLIKSFPHVWIENKRGQIIDLANSDRKRKGLSYWDKEKLGKHEMPDLVDIEMINFWREKFCLKPKEESIEICV